MASVGRVKLEEIRRMLDECAPGFVWREKKHHYWVTFGGRTYLSLPKGEHGGKGEIERGHIKKMARFLGILECAKAKLSL
jgi:hypothetical protein